MQRGRGKRPSTQHAVSGEDAPRVDPISDDSDPFQQPTALPGGDKYLLGHCVSLAAAMCLLDRELQLAVVWFNEGGGPAIAHAIAYDPQTGVGYDAAGVHNDVWEYLEGPDGDSFWASAEDSGLDGDGPVQENMSPEWVWKRWAQETGYRGSEAAAIRKAADWAIASFPNRFGGR